MSVVDSVRFGWKALSLKRVPALAPERVQALQQRRLTKLVRHAVAASPYYREKYAGIDPNHFALTDLPPTNKRELMEHFNDLNTDRAIDRKELQRFLDDPENLGKLFLGRYAVSHTSGSQGQPMLIVQPQKNIELLFALQSTRGNSETVNPVEAVRRLIQPARLAVVTLKRGSYPSASAFEYMPPSARTFVRLLRLSQTDDDVVEQLNAFRPTHLTAYAGVLNGLADAAAAGRLQLEPALRQVTNNSEILAPKTRARVTEIFGVPLLDNYATGECPFLSNGCPAGPGVHINADWAILEVVDEHYQPVPAGRPGRKVLITNLANRVQPIIRYEVDDVVVMATEPCSCGSRLPLLAEIGGRATDAFWIWDGAKYRRLTAIIFQHAFEYVLDVREWQATQEERNRIKLRLELLPGAHLNEDQVWAALKKELSLYGLWGLLTIELEVVPGLEPDPKTNKLRRTLSRVGDPKDFTQPPPSFRDRRRMPRPPARAVLATAAGANAAF